MFYILSRFLIPKCCIFKEIIERSKTGKLQSASILKFKRLVEKFHVTTKEMDDTEATNDLDEFLEVIQELYDGCDPDSEPKSKSFVSFSLVFLLIIVACIAAPRAKMFKAALNLLSTEEDIEYIKESLAALVETCKNYEHQDMMQPDVADFNLSEWSSGVEPYQACSEDEVITFLTGSNESKTLPFFNEYRDVHTVYTPWSKDPESVEWFRKAAQGNNPEAQKLFLHWYQLVGVTCMVDRVFKGDGTLLADEVGLGKLIQVIAVITTLIFQREMFERTGNFTGLWSGCIFIFAFIFAQH